MNTGPLSHGTLGPIDLRPAGRRVRGLPRGWLIVLALTLVMTMVYGASFSFSIFLKPVSDWFGWARTATSGAYAVSLWTSGLLGVLMGFLTDRYGPRLILTAGGLLGGLGYIILASTNSLWQFYTGFAVIALNTSATWTPITATVSRWFDDNRALALGTVTAGIGLGQMVMPLLVAHLIGHTGWQAAYGILAVMTLAVVIPAAIPTRHSPRSRRLLADGASSETDLAVGGDYPELGVRRELSFREAAGTRAFWTLVVLNVLIATNLFMAGIHIAAYATDVGITPTSAALAVSAMGGANIAAKVISGAIATRLGARKTLFFFVTLQSVALFSLAGSTSLSALLGVAVLFGAAIGGGTPPLTAMVAEFFGLRSVGVIMGVIGIGWAAGCAAGTLLGDFVFDISGSYTPAFLAAGGLAVVAAVSVLMLRPPARARPDTGLAAGL